MSYQTLEGWCADPFAQHEERWLSDGRETTMVRDGDTASSVEPPEGSTNGRHT